MTKIQYTLDYGKVDISNTVPKIFHPDGGYSEHTGKISGESSEFKNNLIKKLTDENLYIIYTFDFKTRQSWESSGSSYSYIIYVDNYGNIYNGFNNLSQSLPIDKSFKLPDIFIDVIKSIDQRRNDNSCINRSNNFYKNQDEYMIINIIKKIKDLKVLCENNNDESKILDEIKILQNTNQEYYYKLMKMKEDNQIYFNFIKKLIIDNKIEIDDENIIKLVKENMLSVDN
jgi:hypothetical protein